MVVWVAFGTLIVAGSWWDINGVFFLIVLRYWGWTISPFSFLFLVCPLCIIFPGYRVGLDTAFGTLGPLFSFSLCCVWDIPCFLSRGFPLHCLLVEKRVLNASFL